MTDPNAGSTGPDRSNAAHAILSLSTSGAATGISKSIPMKISIDHSRLLETDSESIRIFLRKYDQFSNEVQARSRRLASRSASTGAARPVDLKFCVDVDLLESSILLGFIKEASSYEHLTDQKVRAFLESRSVESREVVTLEKLDEIVAINLRTNMRITNGCALARSVCQFS